MNTGCNLSESGKHVFYTTPVGARVIPKDGSESPFDVSTFHTCISCGHRRGIDVIGRLWYFDAESEKWFLKLGE